jgi:hypothetical protein
MKLYALNHRFPDFFLRDPLELEKNFRGPIVKKFLAGKLSYHVLKSFLYKIKIVKYLHRYLKVKFDVKKKKF